MTTKQKPIDDNSGLPQQAGSKAPSMQGPDPVDLYVGKRLYLRRNSMGITQEQLAKATGLTFQQIQKYEKGLNRIAASRLYHISHHLKVDVNYFFNGFERMGVAPNPGFSDQPQEPLAGAPAARVSEADQASFESEIYQLITTHYNIADARRRRHFHQALKAMFGDIASNVAEK